MNANGPDAAQTLGSERGQINNLSDAQMGFAPADNPEPIFSLRTSALEMSQCGASGGGRPRLRACSGCSARHG